MAKAVPRRTGGISTATVRVWLSEWDGLDSQVKSFTKRKDTLRDKLKDLVLKRGAKDADGHVWLELEEPVGDISALKAQRSVTKGMDMQAVEDLCRRKGYWKDTREGGVLKWVPTFDGDAFAALVYRETQQKGTGITSDEFKSVLTEEISYAFHPQRVKGRKG